MKRDARIGLAVVLVLGLAVTLLIGRAISKRDAETAGDDNGSADGSAAYSSDVARVDGVDASRISAAAASAPNTAAQGTAVPSETATARPPDTGNTAAQRFIEDQTRRIQIEGPGATPPPARTEALPPPPTAGAGALSGPGAGVTAGNSSQAPSNGGATHGQPGPVDSTLFDHEQSTPPAAQPQLPGEGYTYKVAEGDNLWKISAKVFGDGKYTQKILDSNSGLNPQKLKPGMVIRIPVIANKTMLMKLPAFGEAARSAVAQSGGESPGGQVPASKAVSAPEKTNAEAATHKIEAGETLSGIAQKYYGASGPKTIAKIMAANKKLDPAKLKVGQEIILPPK